MTIIILIEGMHDYFCGVHCVALKEILTFMSSKIKFDDATKKNKLQGKAI